MFLSEIDQSEYQYFYGTYLRTLKESELLSLLKLGKDRFLQVIQDTPDALWRHAYAEEKWTVAQVYQHIIDTERVFQYRAFCFARKEKTPLPGFEQDDYVEAIKNTPLSKAQIIEEYSTVRNATIALFNSFSKEVLLQKGRASNMPWSVGGTGFVICGHQQHHQNILNERYFVSKD